MPPHRLLPQIALAGLCVTACAGSDLRPEWYVKPSTLAIADRSVIGRGACPAEAEDGSGPGCAVEAAKADLASSIRTRIRVAVRLRCNRHTEARQQQHDVEKRGRASCDLVRDAELTPNELELDNLMPTEQSCPGDGYCYALIVASRAELALRTRARMADRMEALRTLVRGAEHADTLIALPMVAQAEQFAQALEGDADILHAITRGRDPWLSLLEQPARLRARWTKRTSVCLEQESSTPETLSLLTPILDELAQAGFSQAHLAGPDGCAGAGLTLSLLSLDDEPSVQPGATGQVLWVAIQHAVLMLADDVQGTEKRVEVHGRAVAATAEKARAAVEEDLKQQARMASRALLWGT